MSEGEARPNPTITFKLEIFERTESGQWGWVPDPEHPETAEYVYSPTQLLRALVAYATMAARIMSSKVGRFRMLAYERIRGALVGHYEWGRSSETGRLLPACEPWTHWITAPTAVAA
ncbi:hypothetical protein [Streptomyces sp. cg36]|uniref:hypothetical protein n=1 Tax=Streptomyces sp. cg36 TaxID=3238798 RepID=UPI0034E2297E